MKRASKVGLIALLAVAPTMAHYLTDAHSGPAHDIYQRAYYLPVILAGLWFGLRGGLLTAGLIAIAYFPHVLHGWHGPHSLFYRTMEVAMYVGVGALTGWLSGRLQVATQEAEEAYRNLKRKTDALFSLEEQLRRSDRLSALGQLTAGLAHEIRNPLASIKTSVEIMSARDRDVPRRDDEPDFGGIILEETARLDRILSEFLQFARTEQTRQPGEPHCCRVGTALRKVRDLTEPQLKRNGVRVVMDEAELDVPVGVCDSHLRQVFLNLLINSLDAMPAGGEFRVHRLSGQDNKVTLQVEDTGPGIGPEIASKVFDPFFTQKSSGTGLGLSIVERVLHSHGGSIKLDIEEAPSSRFIITLPMVGS